MANNPQNIGPILPAGNNIDLTGFNAAAALLEGKNDLVNASIERIRRNNGTIVALMGDLSAAARDLTNEVARIRQKVIELEQARNAVVNELEQLRAQPRADPAEITRLQQLVAEMNAAITKATELLTTASAYITELIQAADADGPTVEQIQQIVGDMQIIKDKIVELSGILPGPPNNPVAVALGGRRGRKRGKTRKIKRRQHKQRGGFQYNKVVKRPALKSRARTNSRSSSKSRSSSQTRSNRYRNKSRQRY